MAVPNGNDRNFTSPSPGQILKQQVRRPRPSGSPEAHSGDGTLAVSRNPFDVDIHSAALMQRGVLLAPLLIQWRYKVTAARPFAKWLKTKELLLSDARLGINEQTAGVHYFGTYIVEPEQAGAEHHQTLEAVDCQTVWGFAEEEAMEHMFDLCRGKVERVSIVENDLCDIVMGLKNFIRETGSSHFSQTVLVAPAAI